MEAYFNFLKQEHINEKVKQLLKTDSSLFFLYGESVWQKINEKLNKRKKKDVYPA